uniref:Olfactory receptor n=1 Tax=Podarcis muralis TaxID=64176 RepID=A0A670JJR0_PODMU
SSIVSSANKPIMFILLNFNNEDLWVLFSILFLPLYFVTIAGNILIVILVILDQRLHTPMYFFLGNLSCLETCYSSTIMPRMLVSFLTGDRTISIKGCFTQLYFFGSFAAAECYLLAVMSYDRYLAICRPLHYVTLMDGRICIMLIAGSWISGFLGMNIVLYFVSQLRFCGPNKINHFFCDLTPMVRLSCILPSFLITLTSYAFIINSILRIASTTGKQKAFSTCSSHLTVVACFYGSLMIVYVLPNMNSLSDLKKVFSLFYTLLTPLVNPLVYSLRNKEVKEAIKKTLFKMFNRIY